MSTRGMPVGEYTRHYQRGWRASEGGGANGALDRADIRGEPEAWYDGYMDCAVGREQFHSRECDKTDHGQCE